MNVCRVRMRFPRRAAPGAALSHSQGVKFPPSAVYRTGKRWVTEFRSRAPELHLHQMLKDPLANLPPFVMTMTMRGTTFCWCTLCALLGLGGPVTTAYSARGFKNNQAMHGGWKAVETPHVRGTRRDFVRHGGLAGVLLGSLGLIGTGFRASAATMPSTEVPRGALRGSMDALMGVLLVEREWKRVVSAIENGRYGDALNAVSKTEGVLNPRTLLYRLDLYSEEVSSKVKMMNAAALMVYYEEVRYNDKHLEDQAPTRQSMQYVPCGSLSSRAGGGAVLTVDPFAC